MARVKQVSKKSTAFVQDKSKKPATGGVKKREHSKEKTSLGPAKVRKNAAWYARRYRELAKTSGFLSRSKNSIEAQGIDSTRCLVTTHDAARLMRFQPKLAHGEEIDHERTRVLREGAPRGAAAAVAMHADQLLRVLMLRAVRLAVDKNEKRVSPATMHSVLRAFQRTTPFAGSAPAPLALVRELQHKNVLQTPESEKDAVAANAKVANASAARDARRAENRKLNKKMRA